MRLKCSTFYPVCDWQSGLCCHLVEGIKFYSDRSDFIPQGEKAFFKNHQKTSTPINKQLFLDKTAYFKTMTSNGSIMQCWFLALQLCFTISWSDKWTIKHHFPPQSGFPVNSSGLLISASSFSATGWRRKSQWMISLEKILMRKAKGTLNTRENDSDRLWCLTPPLVV